MPMKKVGILIFLFLCAQVVHTQKLVRKTIASTHISFFEIDTQNCYRVDIGTSDSGELVVEAESDGEYGRDFVVRVQEGGSTARISAGFSPDYVVPGDKLSTHKLISIALRINLPVNSNVLVNGYGSDVGIRGSYIDLAVVLNDGRCTLQKPGKKVSVHTLSGDIIVKGATGLINAKSTYGKVYQGNIPKGDAVLNLDTVKGDIVLNSKD